MSGFAPGNRRSLPPRAKIPSVTPAAFISATDWSKKFCVRLISNAFFQAYFSDAAQRPRRHREIRSKHTFRRQLRGTKQCSQPPDSRDDPERADVAIKILVAQSHFLPRPEIRFFMEKQAGATMRGDDRHASFQSRPKPARIAPANLETPSACVPRRYAKAVGLCASPAGRKMENSADDPAECFARWAAISPDRRHFRLAVPVRPMRPGDKDGRSRQKDIFRRSAANPATKSLSATINVRFLIPRSVFAISRVKCQQHRPIHATGVDLVEINRAICSSPSSAFNSRRPNRDAAETGGRPDCDEIWATNNCPCFVSRHRPNEHECPKSCFASPFC